MDTGVKAVFEKFSRIDEADDGRWWLLPDGELVNTPRLHRDYVVEYPEKFGLQLPIDQPVDAVLEAGAIRANREGDQIMVTFGDPTPEAVNGLTDWMRRVARSESPPPLIMVEDYTVYESNTVEARQVAQVSSVKELRDVARGKGSRSRVADVRRDPRYQ